MARKDYIVKTFGDTWCEMFKSEVKKLEGDITMNGYDFPIKDILALAEYIKELRAE